MAAIANQGWPLLPFGGQFEGGVLDVGVMTCSGERGPPIRFRGTDAFSECYFNASCRTPSWASSMNLEDQHFLRNLGFRIRDRRQAKQWTQQDLADKCGLHRTFVGSVERGERNLAILNIKKIAKVLRIDLVELFRDA